MGGERGWAVATRRSICARAPVEALRVLAVEGVAVDAADEADVIHVLLDLLLEVALLGERVDHDAEDDVEQHHDDHHVEEQVDRPPDVAARRVVVHLVAHVGECLREAVVVEAWLGLGLGLGLG